MKYIVLILDGAADRPIAWLNGRTCLEAAFTPNLDRLVPESTVGLVCNVLQVWNPQVLVPAFLFWDMTRGSTIRAGEPSRP